MIRLDQIDGLTVISAKDGQKLGKVVECVIDGKAGHLCGVCWKPKVMFKGMHYAEIDKIMLFGKVSLLLNDACSGGKKPVDRLKIGQKVYLADGSSIGWFTNALINEADGEINMLEVSRGYFDDLTGGREWLSKFSWSGGRIIVL